TDDPNNSGWFCSDWPCAGLAVLARDLSRDASCYVVLSGCTIRCCHQSSAPPLSCGELLLGNLSETGVVVGNAPHDRPGLLVGHLIGNRASFLSTKAPLCRIPDELSG